STSVNVKPKANLDVNGLGSSYAPGEKIPAMELKLSGVEKAMVRVTVTTTIPGTPTKDQPSPPDVVIVDSQVVDVAASKTEKVALRSQTADKKTVMIGEGGSNP